MRRDVNLNAVSLWLLQERAGRVAGSRHGAPALSALGRGTCLLSVEVAHATGSQLSAILGSSGSVTLGKVNRPTRSGVSHS